MNIKKDTLPVDSWEGDVYGHGFAINYRVKDKRAHARSEHQFIPRWIKDGEKIIIEMTGDHNDLVKLNIGIPGRGDIEVVNLVSGINELHSNVESLLSVVNNNETGHVKINLISHHQCIPYYKLDETTSEGWLHDMESLKSAPVVLLSSKYSDIIVDYTSAERNIVDVEELMREYDNFITIQDNVTGVLDNGEYDFKKDPNRNLHIECFTSGYMFATDGYTGYIGSAAMKKLLTLDDCWGVWHENGHQRQQTEWCWSAGNGMTEVTVNIFSMFCEENKFGKSDTFIRNKDKIQAFLNLDSQSKDYDTAELYVKMGLFWQLRLTFGENFYPQLFQKYRLMQNLPTKKEVIKQKQLLIKTVSELVGVNMIPFFEKWGIYATLQTEYILGNFPVLEDKIWGNFDSDIIELSLPNPGYHPKLPYIKDSIRDVTISPSEVAFTIDEDWYGMNHYVVRINGKYLLSCENGTNYYSKVSIVPGGYRISTLSNLGLSHQDVISITHDGDKNILYKKSIINSIANDKFSDLDDSDITRELSQERIDQFHRFINEKPFSDDLYFEQLSKYYQLQKNAVLNSVKDVFLTDSEFHIKLMESASGDYNYTLYVNDQKTGMLVNGIADRMAIFNKNVWSLPIKQNQTNFYKLTVIVLDKEYIIMEMTHNEVIMSKKINDCYDESGDLIKNLTPLIVKELELELSSVTIRPKYKQTFSLRLKEIHSKLAARQILKFNLDGNTLGIYFDMSKFYEEYIYDIRSDNGYLCHIEYGQNYYSHIDKDQCLWEYRKINNSDLGTIYIRVGLSEYTYDFPLTTFPN